MRSTLLLLHLAVPQLDAQAPAPPLVITGVTVIAMAGPPELSHQTVLIEGGRITAIGRTPAGRRPAGALVIDGRGKYLIPGLWDMHMHLASRPYLTGPEGLEGIERNRHWAFPLLLAHGVLGVRDMAGELSVLTHWRSQIGRREILGPRLVVTGRKLGKAAVVTGAPDPVASEEDVRRSVEMLRQGGADFVKLDGLPGKYYPVLFEAAQRAHLPVAGHATRDLSAFQISRLGQNSLEHMDGVVLAASAHESAIQRQIFAESGWWRWLLTRVGLSNPAHNFRQRYRDMLASQSDSRTDSLIRTFLEYDTWQVPTIGMLRNIRLVPNPPGRGEAMRRNPSPSADATPSSTPWESDTALAQQLFRREMTILKQMIRLGVPVMAGSDGPGGQRRPGAALIEELELLVDAGMTPAQALASATREPARYLGALDSMGTIEVGKVADLVLLDDNPLVAISALWRIRGVIRGGVYLDRRAITALQDSALALAH